MTNPSRKDLHDFHAWIKTLPWPEVRFMYQTYEAPAERETKTKALFERFQKEKEAKVPKA